MDLNLKQKEVAELLDISETTINYWEINHCQISLRFKPRVFDFIGFCPYDASLPINLKLKERRKNLGLSIKELSKKLKVDPCTIAYWERNEHQPVKKSLKIIEGFLKSYKG